MNILWLEDRPEMMRFDFSELQRLTTHTYEIVESPYEIISRIAGTGNEYDMLIIDIMNPSTPTLKIENKIYNTSQGLETGLVLYEYFLLHEFQKEVIFYTSRSITSFLKKKVEGWKNTKLISKKDFKTKLLNYLIEF